MTQQLKHATAELQATLHAAAAKPTVTAVATSRKARAARKQRTLTKSKALLDAMEEPSLSDHAGWAFSQLASPPCGSWLPIANGAMTIPQWIGESSVASLKRWIQFKDMPVVLLAASVAGRDPATTATAPREPLSASQQEAMQQIHALVQASHVNIMPAHPSSSATSPLLAESRGSPADAVLILEDSDSDSDTDSHTEEEKKQPQQRKGSKHSAPHLEQAPHVRPLPPLLEAASSPAQHVSPPPPQTAVAATDVTWDMVEKQAAAVQQRIDDLAAARQSALRNKQRLGALSTGGAK